MNSLSLKKLQIPLLAITPTLIWGSTWYTIRFQLGEVDPLVSVFFRFSIAGLLILGFCLVTRRSLYFPWKMHLTFALLGTFLFGINYWLAYEAGKSLTSALIAIIYSTIIFMNIFNSAIFLKRKLDFRFIYGAFFAFTGTFLIFIPELEGESWQDASLLAVALCFGSVLCASFGNITSTYYHQHKVPILQSTGFAMVYGSILMLLMALITGKEITMSFQFEYIASLSYLILFGSIGAFSTYLNLLGKLGPEKAAYVLVFIPVVSIIISSFLEDYQVSSLVILGVLLIIGGNVYTMKLKPKS